MLDKKCSILILTAYYLPGFKSGGPIRTLSNLVDNLGSEFDFKILTSDRDFLDKSSYPDLQVDQWIHGGEHFKVCYLSPKNRSFMALHRFLKQAPYDILYLNSFFSYTFTIMPLLLRRFGFISRCPVVLAPRGEFSSGALSMKVLKKNIFIGFAKILGLYGDVLWQASSVHEAEDIRKIFGWKTKIHIAPNLPSGVTAGQFPETAKTPKKPGHLKMVFLSRISRMKNLDTALSILKEVKGEVIFDIFGPLEDRTYWEECQAQIKNFPKNLQVNYKGPVPYGQVKGTLLGYDLFFLPTHGENFGHVILEALNAGCPVLISDQTPWRNLQSKGVGWDLSLTHPEIFREVLQRFIDMTDVAHQGYCAAARDYGLRVSQDDQVIEFNRMLFHKAKTRQISSRESVLIGSLPPPEVGQSLAFQMLCQGYQERGLPFSVIDIGGSDTDRRDGSFSFSRLGGLLKSFFQAMTLLMKKKKNLYLTIAQSWNGFMRDLVFIVLGWMGGHRLVLHLHGGNYNLFYASQSNFRKRLIRWALSKSNRIVVLGESLRGMFHFLPSFENKISVVLNGIPMNEKNLPKNAKHLPKDSSTPIRILYLSNLIESKGYLYLLEAVRILVKEWNLPVECHFCGRFLIARDSVLFQSPMKAEEDFFRRIHENGLEKEVIWKKTVQSEEKEKELQEAHFFVLPTHYDNEGQPLSIIEALAYGCVVLSTEYRTIPEMLNYGNAGSYVPFENPKAIADVIRHFVSQPVTFQNMSEEAMKQYEKHFTREVHLESLIRQITDGRVNENSDGASTKTATPQLILAEK